MEHAKQNELTRLCLRKTSELNKSLQSFFWIQYLTKS